MEQTLPTTASNGADPAYYSITSQQDIGRTEKVIQCWAYLLRFSKRLYYSRPRHIIKQTKKRESTVKSVCGYAILYQTDNNLMLKQHQVESSR